MSISQCAACNAIVPRHDTVHAVSDEHSDRLLCTACFNREMAMRAGIDNFGSFENGVGNGVQRAFSLKREKSSFPATRKRTVRMVSKRAYP
jgi:hypothetical protein